jgi:hypothetical protein
MTWAIVKRRGDRRIKVKYVSARKGLNEADTYIKTLKRQGKETK